MKTISDNTKQQRKRGKRTAPEARIARFLSGVKFPKSKAQLLGHASARETRGRTRDSSLLELLGRLPERTYRNIADVAKGLGKVR